MKKIKLLLADDNEHMRASLKELLELDDSIDIVGEAKDGKDVLDKIDNMEPEIIIMDVNMPTIDGIETTKQITFKYPQISVIMISVNDEQHNFKQAMLAGAKEYLIKPISPNELISTVKNVAEFNRARLSTAPPREEKVEIENITSALNEDINKLITVFGAKGGVGKSIISTNLAVELAQKYKEQVGVIDLDVQFGDVSVIMNIYPRKTISELVQEDKLSKELLIEYIYERNGVQILAAPNKPEYAELVTPDSVSNVINLFKEMHHYTIIDMPSFIDENSLAALEAADTILLVVTLDLPTIKNVKKGLELLKPLELLSKTKLILNRSSGVAGIEPRDVEKVLDMKIDAEIPSDGKLVISSLNQGVPLVKLNPRATISKSIANLMRLIESL
ncbi:Type II/IV secretion system ATPase TadZ/CpaE, associated with Flp pilus assembly [Candidatus Syntrophocurvum alkaliphilum]|uniref:Stage 0 sporulation protein A homolog n=1 Tax=Candidatus Syntrophocurvum alkaliphilum TaxID=2293317 RepID=A0A6I6DKP7_9FIRM|nr:response regulator [Candidatus Syntrophocurvum alkaliphilum]QGU00105.1 Type II/IV secretion system ATPase TadZ/CpaE, associated with Flp pilus assembly [Candidatus Syntrophocurvum alkaliphilum]